MNSTLVRAISLVVWVGSVALIAAAVIAFSGHPAPFVIWLSERVRVFAGIGAPLVAMGILVVLAGVLVLVGARIWGIAGRAARQPKRR
jgi:hypothetical protein